MMDIKMAACSSLQARIVRCLYDKRLLSLTFRVYVRERHELYRVGFSKQIPLISLLQSYEMEHSCRYSLEDGFGSEVQCS